MAAVEGSGEIAPRVRLRIRAELKKFDGDTTDDARLVETVVIEDGRVVERVVHRREEDEDAADERGA